jgi:hypothetical protein
MGEKKVLKVRFLHTLWAAIIILFVIWLMSILECNLATPVY